MLRKTSPKTIVGKIRIEKHLKFTGETHQDYSTVRKSLHDSKKHQQKTRKNSSDYEKKTLTKD